jgi:hypothetical protein
MRHRIPSDTIQLGGLEHFVAKVIDNLTFSQLALVYGLVAAAILQIRGCKGGIARVALDFGILAP